MHVVLMGLRASGKSTLGRALAQKLGRDFVDLDDRTCARLGRPTVADALRECGEPRFRRAECDVLGAALASEAPLVIALGGGTPTAPGASALLLEAQHAGKAWIAYLRASPCVLQERMSAPGSPERPSLTGAGSVEEVPVIFAQRDALYTRLATRLLDAEKRSIEQLVEEIVGHMHR